MHTFSIDDDVAQLVEQLAEPKPFETFSDALRRLLRSYSIETTKLHKETSVPATNARPRGGSKKAPSPNPAQWAASVSDLRHKPNLNSWKAICVSLKVNTAGDSARRKLKNWVRLNRPSWPPVPDID